MTPRFLINSICCLTFFYLANLGQLNAQSFIELGRLDVSQTQQAYSAPSINKSVTGEPIILSGKVFKEGVAMYGNAHLKIKLHGAHTFSALVGVGKTKIDYASENTKTIPLTDGKRLFYHVTKTQKQFLGLEGADGKIDQGSVIFKVLHKGKEVFNSGIMRTKDTPKEINLKVKGGVLELITENANDGSSGDNALWAHAQLEYFEVAPTALPQEFLGEAPEQPEIVKNNLLSKVDRLSQINLPIALPNYDWLIDNSKAIAQVLKTKSGKDIILSNGLISRTFRVAPNLATIDYTNLMTGQSLLRAASNEGLLTIDGKVYTIGGLSNQPEYGYTLMKWIDGLSATPNSFLLQDFEIKEIEDRLEWKRVRWALNKEMPKGKELIFTLAHQDIIVKVHFALYNGIPTLSKWIEVINNSNLLVQLNNFKLEQLAMVEGESLVDIPDHWVKPNIHVETDYAFGAMQPKTSNKTTFWEKDPRYTSQTNYPLALPCVLEVRPPLGPDTGIPVGGSLTTFRVWETPMDSRDEERVGLFKRKLYRTISPWTTENPIFLHLTSTDEKVIKNAVDQCAVTGYEMIILSFGSGLNMEKEKESYYNKYKELREYANSKGIELGGYSLLSSRWISDEVDVINPETGKRGGMIFGSSPCLSSEWGYDYFRKIKTFFDKTGMQVFENDGSYPGNVCASITHAHHNGLGDSQWKQYAQIQDLYMWMRSEGIYMNVPDFYINSGTNKTGIGYREVNWSLPRERQLVLGRQNIYDGLWDRIPSMNWTFVPLTQYHGGGAAATMEPLKDHLRDYENHMMQNYGSGVQACYRGPRLYDSEETKQTVIKVIDWYKKYRDILNSDIIHLRRPSGKDWDGILHANPNLDTKGLAMFYNPTDTDMIREIKLPLYYTGLETEATISIIEQSTNTYKLNRDYSINLNISIPAKSYTWITIK
ncbi:NPCBM/NEW2 domain-containing protein [Urechidicola vernalis]|uniref:NPCBM/NEW2 domain-containing protein n=1 Tax=Urechidicola vernalis TaxID=3075600 RepID=A0ABU2Y4D0_9FLAO|nr:NPCBM/NEW2 domain-containing protein [Urechidicola sp. P050]MDT0553058.1 NPCBM/NEW2 domain-containing protein [Urechidicola sp. P050]